MDDDDSYAKLLKEDEQLREASTTFTYVYYCSVNLLQGVHCTLYFNQDVPTNSQFPMRSMGIEY
jgi:hypothetical protein